MKKETILEILKDNNVIEYLEEYQKLCQKYKMGLNGCGCCGSPYLCIYKNEEVEHIIDNINYDCEENIINISYMTFNQLKKEINNGQSNTR